VNRRDFLHTAGLVSASIAFPKAATPLATDSKPTNWRSFEITTRVEILQPSGITRMWLPTALLGETPFQKTLANTFNAEGGTAKIIESKPDSLGVITAEFPDGVRPVLTATSRIATRDYAVDLSASAPANPKKENRANLDYFLRSTKLLPTDGIVKSTADEITAKANAHTDVEKARAIYEWIVDNTTRNPKTRGCGTGDIRFMLETKDLSGKCADLNALYVGLARAAGLPARDVYGIRVAKSDPADVRKVILEEPPANRPLDDELVKQTRARLFGSWEMNWMAYNFAHDVSLPGSTGKSVGFLMYPQAETNQGRLDCLDPDNFKYEITSRETTASA
jgi:hypothetical protein